MEGALMKILGSVVLVAACAFFGFGCSPSISGLAKEKNAIAIPIGVDLSQYKVQAVNSTEETINNSTTDINSTTF